MPLRLKGILAAVGVSALVSCAASPPPRTPPEAAAPVRQANFHSTLLWSNGASVRYRVWMTPRATLEETTADGRVSFVLRRGTTLYFWQLGAKGGVEGFGSAAGRLAAVPDPLETLASLPKLLAAPSTRFRGEETIGGWKTRRYDFEQRVKKSDQLIEGSVWVLEDRLFPIRYVRRGFGGDFEILNTDVRFDVPIPPAFLEPPPNVEFRRVQSRAP